MDIQQKIESEMDEFAEKLAKAAKDRCWEGYKPAPGKKPYSEDSCVKKGDKPCGVCKACKSMKKAEDKEKPIGDKSEQESKEEKARKEKDRKLAQDPKSKEKNVDASKDAARAGATEAYQEKVDAREVKKGDDKPDENGSTDEYDKEADPKKPFEPVKKPKIKLPDSAMKRKMKEQAMEKSETAEMIQQILDSARAMGKEEFKKSVTALSPEQQILVGKILEKGRKPAAIGTKSPDGKRIKTADGWKPVKGSGGSSKKEEPKSEGSDKKEKPKSNISPLVSYEVYDENDKLVNWDTAPAQSAISRTEGAPKVKFFELESDGMKVKRTGKELSSKDMQQKIKERNEMFQRLREDKKKQVKKSEGETEKEMDELLKAIEFDDVAAPAPENEKDLPQEEVKDGNQYEWGDREDKKVMKENAATVNHQGDLSPEGRDGHEIADPKPQRDWEKFAEDYDFEKDQNPHAANLDAYAKIRKGENMEQLDEVLKSEDKSKMLMKRMIAKGMKKADCMDKMKKMGYDMDKMSKMWDDAEKEDQPEEKKMEKSLVWNDWQSDALGSSVKRGRNAHYTVEDALLKSEEERSERLAKGDFLNVSTGEKLEKSEEGEEKKPDLNDIIEKGFDRSRDQIEEGARIAGHKPFGSSLTKSFEDAHIAATLGLTQDQVAEILGESKKTEE